MPASLLTHRTRQAERLADAIDQLWHRDHGQHRDDIRRIQALIDAGQLNHRDADRMVRHALSRSQNQMAAA